MYAAKPSALSKTSELPRPDESGIQHIVVVTMENRSFDHFLGWLPNADGRQAGLSFGDKAGVTHQTHSLSGDFTGCPGADPDHSYNGARIEYSDGKMDGFLRAGHNDPFCLGFYGEHDLIFLGALAWNYTACDRYFAAFLGPTFPNRMFLHAAQTDRLDDSVKLSSLPTIWDRLKERGISANYFFSNIPYLALWGTRHLGICRLHEDFLEAAREGTLPAVSFVDPHYTVIDDGAGDDDHPHADIRKGDKFLYDIFEAVSNGSGWANTVLVINFDEWGGFYDHIVPPTVEDDNVNPNPGPHPDYHQLGFRVPCIVVSPWSPATIVSDGPYEHCSTLRMIEWRWALEPMSLRDKTAKNLATTMDFSMKRAPAKLPKFTAPVPVTCPPGSQR